MCGRTACTLAPDELCSACASNGLNVSWREHPGSGHSYAPSYNVAPTAHTPIIFSGQHLKSLCNEEADTDFIIQPMMWNLVPHFYKGDTPKSHGYKTNNCRVESVHEKPMFSHLMKKGHRCVVLCDGFYEWQTNTKEKKKTPYLIYAPQPDHVRVWERSSWEGMKPEGNGWQGPTPLKMAGLFSRWKSTDGEEVWSYTVLTMEAGSGFNWLHHRVPVMLETEEQVQKWLDPGVPASEVLDSVSDSPSLKWHVVSGSVNNSRNNFVDCLKPAEAGSKKPSTPSSNLMTAWLSKASRQKAGDGDGSPNDAGVTTKSFIGEKGSVKRKASEPDAVDQEDKKTKLN